MYESTIMNNQLNICILREECGIITEGDGNVKDTLRKLLNNFIKLCTRIKDAIKKKIADLKSLIFKIIQKAKKIQNNILKGTQTVEVEVIYVDYNYLSKRISEFDSIFQQSSNEKFGDFMLSYNRIANVFFDHTGDISDNEILVYLTGDNRYVNGLEKSNHTYNVNEQKQIINRNIIDDTVHIFDYMKDYFESRINTLTDKLNKTRWDSRDVMVYNNLISDSTMVSSLYNRMANHAMMLIAIVVKNAEAVLNAAANIDSKD